MDLRIVHDNKIKVMIVEDDAAIRESYTSLINESRELICVGAFQTCEDIIEALNKSTSDVILMDIGLPGIDGITGIKLIKSKHPEIEIIMLTVYDDDEKIFNSIYAGASGYLLKKTPSSDLLNAIKDIKTGAPMTPSIARRMLNFLRDNRKNNEGFNLTLREKEILNALVDGLSYKKIAEKLFISPLTVHSHIKKIYEKLHVHSKSEAVAKALKKNIIL